LLNCEANFPFTSSVDTCKRYAKQPKYAAFDVDGVACCTFEMSMSGVTQSSFHAYPTTADYSFDLHVSRTPDAKNKSGAWSRDDFKELVRTFRCEGRVDAAKLDLPVAAYAFRDEAAAHADDQLAWVEAQAKARPDDWAAHFYLGTLGHEIGDAAREISGHERASQLLAAKAEHDGKELLALVRSYDELSQGYVAKKRHRDAIAPLTKLVALVPSGAAKPLSGHRTVALYRMAQCHAKNGDSDEALTNLRAAILELGALKDAAKQDELFDSLRSKPEFKKLVGG
jgi:tetratricopeptide (TPR) repeat protein